MATEYALRVYSVVVNLRIPNVCRIAPQHAAEQFVSISFPIKQEKEDSCPLSLIFLYAFLLSFQIDEFLKHRIGSRNDSGVCLETTLCRNHIRKFG